MNSSDRKRIGELIRYEFKDGELLDTAFTHSSFVNEHGGTGNERLEFLGDCVLNFLVGERLYLDDPVAGEGKLSARRAAVVSKQPLAKIVDALKLTEFMRAGSGVDVRSLSVKQRSNIFEALIGGVYLDGGLDACRKVLDAIFFGAVEPQPDHKSTLQKIAVKAGDVPEYIVTPDGKGFSATVSVGGKKFVGRGSTKHAAEIDAARVALDSPEFSSELDRR